MADALAAPASPVRPVDAYQEHAPPAALASYIECFWSRTETRGPNRSPRSHRVLPDGCADVVVGFDTETGGPAARVVGTMTRAAVFADTTTASYVGVRFQPGVAGALFGIPACELTDQSPDLGDVWPQADAMLDSLAGASDAGGRLRILSAEIARRLLAATSLPPATVVAAATRIAATRGTVSIRTLCSQLGVSRQHLARTFADHVGLSPKMLARVVRMRGVVEVARRATNVDWVSLALDAGYYDQSHLIADVRELTGLSPGEWLGARA
jgi:AraC-like DNA-binding protein